MAAVADDLTTSIASGGIAATVVAAVIGAARWLAGRGDAERAAVATAQAAHLGAALASVEHERAERARERAERDATIAALGRRLDEARAALDVEREARRADNDASAKALLLAREAPAGAPVAAELPTGVRSKLESVDAMLADYTATVASVPPPAGGVRDLYLGSAQPGSVPAQPGRPKPGLSTRYRGP